MKQLRLDPKEPHPDYAGYAIPQEVELGDFRLTMLTAADLDDDMAAIEESGAARQTPGAGAGLRRLARRSGRA